MLSGTATYQFTRTMVDGDTPTFQYFSGNEQKSSYFTLAYYDSQLLYIF